MADGKLGLVAIYNNSSAGLAFEAYTCIWNAGCSSNHSDYITPFHGQGQKRSRAGQHLDWNTKEVLKSPREQRQRLESARASYSVFGFCMYARLSGE